jgi:DNA-binding YbaB/EbfC family protein
MLKGLGGLGGLGDMAKLMKQAQEMQAKMTEAQERITRIEAEGSAGAGMVRTVASGQGDLKSLQVDPTLLDGSHPKEVLEDLIVAAVNDATRKAREVGQVEMAKVTEGMALPPGMKLPF